MELQLDNTFPRYTEYDPKVPVWFVTHDSPCTQHRFFDTSPISPNGDYIALTRFPDDKKHPEPGDLAEVIVIDLKTGKERIVAQTPAWEGQLGAQVQWGSDESTLFFNDMDTTTWEPYAVVFNLFTSNRRKLGHTIYMANSDGTQVVSPCLKRMRRTQAGYGVVVPDNILPVNYGAPSDDGIYVTDVASGKTKMIISIRDIVERLNLDRDIPREYGYYIFHTKWNPAGNRISIKFRLLDNAGIDRTFIRAMWVITLSADAGEIHTAIPKELKRLPSHHHTWWDDRTLTMNLSPDTRNMHFSEFQYDGTHIEPLTRSVLGSGHPSLHPDRIHLISDAYPAEKQAYDDGSVPIRFVNVKTGIETEAVRIRSLPFWADSSSSLKLNNSMRIDPHPAWDRSFRYVTFNGSTPEGRGVFVADMKTLLDDY